MVRLADIRSHRRRNQINRLAHQLTMGGIMLLGKINRDPAPCRSPGRGKTGEVTVTAGFNFCLPLLRKRIGDFAALEFCEEGLVLVDLQGRRSVRYFARGAWINNIGVTHALLPLRISYFNVNQRADASVMLRLCPGRDGAGSRRAVGAGLSVRTAMRDGRGLAELGCSVQEVTLDGPVAMPVSTGSSSMVSLMVRVRRRLRKITKFNGLAHPLIIEWE